MKYIRGIGPLAIVAALTMALAASASATSVSTTTGGAPATPSFHTVNEGGHITLANAVANISCAGTASGKIESHGSGKPASGNLTTLSITGCTNSWHVTTTAPGSISVSWVSGHNGSVLSNGAKVTTTRFGVTCNYETANTPMGTITGGNPPTLDIAASIPIAAGSSALCGSGNSALSGTVVGTGAAYIGS